MALFTKIEKGFLAVVKALLSIDFIIMILLVGGQVLVRFVAANAINTSGWEELTRFLLCYLTFLGAVVLYESHGHVWVANLVDAVPKPVRRIILILSYIVQFAFFVIILIGTKDIMPSLKTQSSSVLHIPFNIVYIGIPFMAVCCMVFCIRDFIYILQGKEV